MALDRGDARTGAAHRRAQTQPPESSAQRRRRIVGDALAIMVGAAAWALVAVTVWRVFT